MVKARQKPLVVPSPADIEAVLRTFSDAPTSVRNRALVALTWRCALRASEALALRPRDIDLRQGTVSLQKTKGDKFRNVFADAGALALLREWLAIRATLPTKESSPVFCTLDGDALDSGYYREMLARKGEKARKAAPDPTAFFGGRWHPHLLRHARSLEMVRSNVSVAVIQKVLGHGDLKVTTDYLRGLGDKDVEIAMRSDWRMPA